MKFFGNQGERITDLENESRPAAKMLCRFQPRGLRRALRQAVPVMNAVQDRPRHHLSAGFESMASLL
jgi:hypothetical protein